MTKHTPTVEDRFAAYQNTDAPADLRRRLVAAIKTIDPVDQLDATGCVLAGVLVDEYRLREINAELLDACQFALTILEGMGNGNGDAANACRAAIARAEGEDR